jgi:hypothetical protein
MDKHIEVDDAHPPLCFLNDPKNHLITLAFIFLSLYIVAYLRHGRTVEPQKYVNTEIMQQ